MLARGHRLTRVEVAEVLAQGRRAGDRALGLRFLASNKNQGVKFAIVVPAREVPLAVKRHQLKRRIRAILAKLVSTLKPGSQIIIFCGHEVSKHTFLDLSLKLKELLNSARLIS